jgi:hypothetical protein
MIDGVKTKNLKVVPDERGWLMEILRNDDDIFENFGQVYMTTAYPGVVKGWHLHKKQTDNFTCIHGMMKVALYDFFFFKGGTGEAEMEEGGAGERGGCGTGLEWNGGKDSLTFGEII